MSRPAGVIEPAAASERASLRIGREGRPRLLVSVRNAEEAAVAIAAGVDLLDVKEPSRGSLGRPAAADLAEIVQLRNALAPTMPVSLALGELAEWSAGDANPESFTATSPDLVKLGLHGMARDRHWRNRWVRLRRSIDEACATTPQHVAVAYADWRTAEAPEPAGVINAAIDTGCAGVLFDTYGKRSGGLLSHLPVEELHPRIDQLHAARLFIAVAGQLQAADLLALCQLPIDVIAVRSAVCIGRDRSGPLSGEQVGEFRASMRSRWRAVDVRQEDVVRPTSTLRGRPDR